MHCHARINMTMTKHNLLLNFFNCRPSSKQFWHFFTCRKVNVSKFFHNAGTLGTFTSSRSSQNEYNVRFGHFNTVKTIKISPRCSSNTTLECRRYDRQRQQHVKWADSRDFSTSEFHAGAFTWNSWMSISRNFW